MISPINSFIEISRNCTKGRSNRLSAVAETLRTRRQVVEASNNKFHVLEGKSMNLEDREACLESRSALIKLASGPSSVNVSDKK